MPAYKKTIDSFQGEDRYLSNFYDAEVELDGIVYKNAEAAFQAQKSRDPAERAEFALLGPSEAKRKGRNMTLRQDWESVKDDIMLQVVTAKFSQHPILAARLKATGNARLIEGNDWGDTYWGVCKGRGRNRLGQILMQVRQDLIDNKIQPKALHE